MAESNSAAMGMSSGQVAITVNNDDQPHNTPSPPAANPKSSYEFYCTICYFSSYIFMLGLLFVRQSRRTLNDDNKNAYLENNVLFMTMTIVKVCVAELTALMLIYIHYRGYSQISPWSSYTTNIKHIGCISAVLATVSVYMVVCVPPKFNWIGLLVEHVVFMMMLALCYWADEHNASDDDHYFPTFAGVIVLVYVALVLLLALFVPVSPKGLDWIIYGSIISYFITNAIHRLS